jgi:selenide,water dikinase
MASMERRAPVRLTSLSHGSGCACKIGPAELSLVVAGLPPSIDPDLLVGAETSDDAGVYRISDDLALVQSVDFFTPIVDDPYDFGRIAATNAFSDIYAMGARPLTALNLVAFSLERLGDETLRDVLRGGADIARDAGVSIVGGHSIDDAEPKYGMAVTGIAHPERVVRNSTAQSGDTLFLTKPIGGGAITTAAKRGAAGPELVARCTEVMTTSNAAAAEAAVAVGATAMTDVTGFGLLGHLHELALASALAAELDAGAVPAIEGAAELIASEQGLSGGSRRNRAYIEGFTSFAEAVAGHVRSLLCDAMTSGGLLVAVPPARAGDMGAALAAVAPEAARIGTLHAGTPGDIAVR